MFTVTASLTTQGVYLINEDCARSIEAGLWEGYSDLTACTSEAGLWEGHSDLTACTSEAGLWEGHSDLTACTSGA